MILQLIEPLSLLLSLSLVLGFVFHFFEKHSIAGKIVSGFVYGIIAVFAMMMPFDFIPGFIFDSRSVIISLSGFFGGSFAAVPAAVIAATYRIHLGGTGAVAGALVVILAAASGTVWYYLRNSYGIKTRLWHFYVFGLISHFISIFGLGILPSDLIWTVVKKLSIPFFFIYPFATVFLGTIIHNIEISFEDKKNLARTKDEYEKLNIALNKKNTELTVADEQIKRSLKEKELLHRELYHRTKNNMQVISAIIDLQIKGVDDDNLQAFNEIQSRIAAMALVHEKLYQSKELSKVNLMEYFFDLINLLKSSYLDISDNVNIRTEMEEAIVTIDSAVPCGLIMNELLSNSFKHAFPENKNGELYISLKKNEDSEIILVISDNGVGISEKIDIWNTDSLGLQSVIALAEYQLNGSVKVFRDNGTRFEIIFKERSDKVRI